MQTGRYMSIVLHKPNSESQKWQLNCILWTCHQLDQLGEEMGRNTQSHRGTRRVNLRAQPVPLMNKCSEWMGSGGQWEGTGDKERWCQSHRGSPRQQSSSSEVIFSCLTDPSICLLIFYAWWKTINLHS